MTATETNTTDRQTDQPGELGELLLVDPATLIVGANVRGVVELDRAFARDIAERGVREPITVRRNPDGELVVRKGKRRALAAVQAGLTQVRVFVDPGTDPDDGDTAGRIARTIDQLAENDHRAELGAEDRVRAHQELLELGLTAGQIARRTHTPTGRVRAAHAVAGSQLAQAVLAKYELTLDQAAVVAEFDDSSPAGAEAAKLLTVTARNEPAQFAHVAQRVRDDWADARRIAEHTAELTSAGVTVLTEQQRGEATSLLMLRPAAGDRSGTELTEAGHQSCPGHAGAVRIQQHWQEGPQLRVDYYCTDPDSHGHAPHYDSGGGGSSKPSGPMSDADKAERRTVIGNNKAWDSATTVRLAWLKAFLAREELAEGRGRVHRRRAGRRQPRRA